MFLAHFSLENASISYGPRALLVQVFLGGPCEPRHRIDEFTKMKILDSSRDPLPNLLGILSAFVCPRPFRRGETTASSNLSHHLVPLFTGARFRRAFKPAPLPWIAFMIAMGSRFALQGFANGTVSRFESRIWDIDAAPGHANEPGTSDIPMPKAFTSSTQSTSQRFPNSPRVLPILP